MLEQILWTDIICVEFGWLFKYCTPSQSTYRGSILEERDRFIHSCNSLTSNYAYIAACWCPSIAIEFSNSLLKLRNEGFRISSNLIGNFKDFFVDS